MDIDSVYKNFSETIRELGVFLYNETDEKIKEIIFEDYPIDSLNLSNNVLELLLSEGYIDSITVEKTKRILFIYREIEADNKANTINEFKQSSKWRELLELHDDVNNSLYI